MIAALDRLLAPYGGRGAYGRDQQTSHRLVTDEIGQMRVMATTIPVVILGVAAFLLSLVLSRLVATQRMQIGTLKALGYGSWAVGRHYAALALVLVAAGRGRRAWPAGTGWASALSEVYARYYRFPAILYEAEPAVALAAAVLAAAAALAAVSGAVRRAVRLAPAEAMRPEPPPTFRPSLARADRAGAPPLPGRAGWSCGTWGAGRCGRRSPRWASARRSACTMVAAFTRDASSDARGARVRPGGRGRTWPSTSPSRSPPGRSASSGRFPGCWGPRRSAPLPPRCGPATARYRTAILGLDPGASLHRVVDVAARGRGGAAGGAPR